MLLSCPRCHHLNPRTEQFCELCGAQLSTPDDSQPQAAGSNSYQERLEPLGIDEPAAESPQAVSTGKPAEETVGKEDPDRIAMVLRDALAQDNEEGRARGEGPRGRGYLLRPLPLPEEGPFPNLTRASSPADSERGEKRHDTSPFSAVPKASARGPLRAAEAMSPESLESGSTPRGAAVGRSPTPPTDALGHTPWSSPAVAQPAARTGPTAVAGSTPLAPRAPGPPLQPHVGLAATGDLRGQPSGDQVVCPQCKAVNPVGNRFCGGCGGRLLLAPKVALAEVRRPAQVVAPIAQPTLRAVLICINEDGSDGDHLVLSFGERIIGRTLDHRFSTDQFLSPRHSRLLLDSNGLQVEDLSSLNGTYLRIRDRVRLNPGDCFLMGRQVLRLDRFDHQINSHMRGPDGTRYMGSPVPGGKYKLVQLGIGGIVQNVYCLSNEGATLGRERGDIVFPADKFMSARHASVTIDQDERVFLSDINSSNGTWIKIVGRRMLNDQDYIFLGQQLFRVAIEAL
ncbi:MAG: FHA domain-containing protein [Bradymonadales bacterium]|nr:FHA domain-containing protein [Bradymonadales bacterium]